MTVDYSIIVCDARKIPLRDKSVRSVCTSPPYYQVRDYGHGKQIGCEPTPGEYVASIVEVFQEIRRVLMDDGTAWLNLGDSYCATHQGKHGRRRSGRFNDTGDAYRNNVAVRRSRPVPPGFKEKDLFLIPHRVAIALHDAGWYVRSDIIWSKPCCMTESVKDRPARSHEHVFLLSKQPRYYYDNRAEAKSADDPALRSVWSIAPSNFPGAHFATMPSALAERCIRATSRPGELILDPFAGAGTTGVAATGLGRRFVGLELSHEYARMADHRIRRPHAPTKRSKSRRSRDDETMSLFD